MDGAQEGPQLLTVGHGKTEQAAFGDLLVGAGVRRVVDVRRFPGSRTSPDVAREALERWLPERGIEYVWERRLGGRRALAKDEDEDDVDSWWTVAAFRAYAAHTRTPEFRAALDEVLAATHDRSVAVMCSESVWWRCHRRLIADVAVLGRGAAVRHLMPGGRISPHRPAEGARVDDDGDLVWDG